MKLNHEELSRILSACAGGRLYQYAGVSGLDPLGCCPVEAATAQRYFDLLADGGLHQGAVKLSFLFEERKLGGFAKDYAYTPRPDTLLAKLENHDCIGDLGEGGPEEDK